MHSLCLLILLASISAYAVGETNVQAVDVSCQFEYDRHGHQICTIQHVDFQSKAPSVFNILNADAINDTTHFKMHGHYTVLPLNFFQLFPKLKILEISPGLEAITKEDLIGGNKLVELKLRENKITEIRPHTFDGMDKLESINLLENKLTKVESSTFVGAINLKNLNLGRNEIDTIEDGAFNLPTLEELILSNNKLHTLADDVFVGCHKLKVIYLDGNELTRIGRSIDNVPKLAWLFFNNNGVRIIDFDFYAIARKPHLEYFVAVNVSLVLDDPALVAHDNYTAERLYISGNNLSYPDILHRLRNFRNLRVLIISGNNFATIDDLENILEMFPKLNTLIVKDVPCKEEVVRRLQTKFGDKVNSIDSTHIYFE